MLASVSDETVVLICVLVSKGQTIKCGK